MKKLALFTFLIILITQYSCITDQNKYKETDIYEEYEADNGFTILHIPPVLFKIALSASDDTNSDSKDLLDKVEVIKLMFFEKNDNTITIDDLKKSMNEKLKKFEYTLLTRIAQENSDISIYVIEKEKIIHEVLITIISDKEYVSLNLVGHLTRDEVMKVYKSIDLGKLHEYDN